ncbi:MAG: YbaB/EbfC family nucleoid-associated protein [Armatimonadetes bacterium]|nr:YbaB/EbfC family nucleoid-associated protein [Armatimonadota bacterium]
MRGFGGMGSLGSMGNLMKQAQKMMEQGRQAIAALENERVEATSGGGIVRAEVSGMGRLVAIEIKPEAVDPEDVEMLQDLVLSAVREAQEKAEEMKKKRLGQLTGGLDLPL